MRLGLFDVSRRWPRQHTRGDDGTSFCEQRNFFSVYRSIRRPYITFTPPQFLPISGDRDVSLPPSLEWHVWPSSSGNNCHAVHRSLSSGASLCNCTVRFFTLSHVVSQSIFYTFLKLTRKELRQMHQTRRKLITKDIREKDKLHV